MSNRRTPANFRDLMGMTFERLVVIERLPLVNKAARWRCRCVCGNEVVSRSHDLTAGLTKSCGCLRRDAFVARTVKHAMYQTKEYKAWVQMIQRCTNPKTTAYARYGGRGITVCDEWRVSFEAFLRDVGMAPGPEFSLDRIDNDRGYRPGNVRWASKKTQANNRSPVHLLTHQGITLSMTEWSERLGWPPSRIRHRLRLGWSIEETLTTPARTIRHSHGSSLSDDLSPNTPAN